MHANDLDALIRPWRDALLERPRDSRPDLDPRYADEEAAIAATQKIVDTFGWQYVTARQQKGEARLIHTALRRFPRIMSDHPAVVRSRAAAQRSEFSYGATVADLSGLAESLNRLSGEEEADDASGPDIPTVQVSSISRPGLILHEEDRMDVLAQVRRGLNDSGLWTAAARVTRNAAQAALVADRLTEEDVEVLSRAWRAVLSESVGHDERVQLIDAPEHPDWLALAQRGVCAARVIADRRPAR